MNPMRAGRALGCAASNIVFEARLPDPTPATNAARFYRLVTPKTR